MCFLKDTSLKYITLNWPLNHLTNIGSRCRQYIYQWHLNVIKLRDYMYGFAAEKVRSCTLYILNTLEHLAICRGKYYSNLVNEKLHLESY